MKNLHSWVFVLTLLYFVPIIGQINGTVNLNTIGNGQLIEVQDGDVFNTNNVGTSLSIQAIPNSAWGTVESVSFSVSQNGASITESIESFAPYSINGDNGSNPNPWTDWQPYLDVPLSFEITYYSQDSAAGTVLGRDNFTITISNGQTASNNGPYSTGGITMERYDNIAGTDLVALFNAPNYPDNPTSVTELASFEIPTNVGTNYGARISGYIIPPETGTYYFWIASDDFSRLDLGSDENFVNMTSIADVPDWTNGREWNKYTNQKSVGINLMAGQPYSVIAYFKEGAGGDNLAVGWRKPSEGDGAEPTEVLPGSVLSPTGPDGPPDGGSSAIAVSGVSLNQSTFSLDVGNTQGLVASVNPSNATDQSVSWSSNNTSVATVSASGLVTAIGEGSATITATTTDGGFSANATVTVSGSGDSNPPPSGGGGDALWELSNNVIKLKDGNHKVSVGANFVPSGYQMGVDGKLIADEIRVEIWNVADYVFEDEYKLLTLEEVAKHIEEKGHLPNIPSAEEIEANGAELGKMTNLLLEKIEEQMLYILQQQEEMEQMKERIQQLEKNN